MTSTRIKKITVQQNQAERPRIVALVAGMQALEGLILIGLGAYALYAGGISQAELFNPQTLSKPEQIYTLGSMLLGFLALVLSGLLFRLSPWAWTMSMALQGVGLITALAAYSQGKPNYILMALCIFMVFYLNHEEVQVTFRGKRGRL